MNVHSIGLLTDLATHRREGLVHDRGEHLVLVVPHNPDYYFGNSLVIPRLEPGALPAWEETFARELPGATHRVLLVDNVEGDPSPAALADAVAGGYEVRRLAVLVAHALAAPPVPSGLRMAPLDGDAEWSALYALLAEVDAAEGREGEAHERYLSRWVASRRRWSQQGTGAWWGAWRDQTLVGSLGLFVDDRRGRYQYVLTAPGARRQGVASALVAEAGRRALSGMCEALVIVTVEGSDAHALYERLGFSVVEHYVDLSRMPE